MILVTLETYGIPPSHPLTQNLMRHRSEYPVDPACQRSVVFNLQTDARRGDAKMDKRISVALCLIVEACFAPPAHAGCKWTQDCSTGECRPVQLSCDSSIKVPAVRPPPGSQFVTPLAPFPRPVAPPAGTTSCRPVYQCNHFRECSWQTVCR